MQKKRSVDSLTDFGHNLFRFSVIILSARENTLSAAALMAGVDNSFKANFDK